MNGLESYISAIRKIQEQVTIPLEVKQGTGRLWINRIEFIPAPLSAMRNTEFRGKGILVERLPLSAERYCKAHEISVLTSNGRLLLANANYQVIFEPKGQSPNYLRVKSHAAGSLRERTLRTRIFSGIFPPPTALISPNGFDILDVLFRMPQNELVNFKYALSFADEFHLNQPKLSNMMRSLHVKTLIELRQKIAKLPVDWWRMALSYPMTRKGLTPFFEAARPYSSIREGLSSGDVQANLQEWLQSKQNYLVQGPTETMRELGLIRDSDIYLWGAHADFQELKKAFQLIPAKNTKDQIWYLATPVAGLEKESIISPIAFANNKFLLPHIKSNIFRAIWDLSFGEERFREIQIIALKRIFDGL